jgi:hypothetical protein
MSFAVFLNIALEMPLGLGGLLILTIDLLTEQVRCLVWAAWR